MQLVLMWTCQGIITSSARDADFPTPLSSLAEQVYLQGISAGHATHDDAGVVRLYYPDPIASVTAQPQTQDTASGEQLSGSALIIALLKAIYICSTAESVAFSHHVGLDLNQFYTLASDAAGGTKIFRTLGLRLINDIEHGKVAREPEIGSLDAVIRDLQDVSLKFNRRNLRRNPILTFI